jgi:hypothetical protein
MEHCLNGIVFGPCALSTHHGFPAGDIKEQDLTPNRRKLLGGSSAIHRW